MRRSDLTLLAVAVGTALVVTVAQDQGPWDLVFQAFVLLMLELVLRQGLVEWRRGSAARRNAAELAAQNPSESALRAVREERARLSTDISAGLRVVLTDIELAARDGLQAMDPEPHTAVIRRRAQEGTSELRRQLGLLRDPVDEADATTVPPSRGASPVARDVLLAAAVTVLAGVECVIYGLDGERFSVASTLLTMAAAGTVVGRRTMPALAAAACGGLYLAGLAWSVPPQGGFWFFATVGGLLWTLADVTTQRRAGAWAALLLFGSAAVTTGVLDSANAAITVVVMAVAYAGGLATATARARAAHAVVEMSDRQEVLERAVSGAVVAERHVFAREIHDVVSHAVGVAAMQAAAAEVSWPHDPARVRACLTTVADTAHEALADLTLVEPAVTVSQRHYSDVVELVDRMRASGVSVALQSNLASQENIDPSLYRVVQEALTNSVRHAPGSRVAVEVVDEDGHVVARVTDTGSNAPSSGHRGYGLIGLEERVAFAGGALSAGPGPDGRGFRVEARLPRHLGAST